MNSNPEDRKMRDDGANKWSRDNPWPLPNRAREQKAEDRKLWGILIFGFIGATATTFAEEYEEEMERATAFRAKAKQFHPDQNQNNKDLAEAKFKEVMTSYEAIKIDRKNK